MTTKVKIINESSNTASDNHNVIVKRADANNIESVALASLLPGESTDVYVWAGHKITIEEV
jgi:hypothetical protein